jgi:hypothetical protein
MVKQGTSALNRVPYGSRSSRTRIVHLLDEFSPRACDSFSGATSRPATDGDPQVVAVPPETLDMLRVLALLVALDSADRVPVAIAR